MIQDKKKNNEQEKKAPFKEVKKDDKLEQVLLEVRRVTRVVAGGKRFRFRVVMVIGDKNGKVGVGVAKGADVPGAVDKAVREATKELVVVKSQNDTIAHEVKAKYGSALVLLKPTKRGRGIIAGKTVRTVCSLAGIGNITGKVLGSSNKLNNARATLKALSSLKDKVSGSSLN